MKLLTKEIRKKLPTLRAQANKGDEAVAYFKLFTPDSNWTWYVLCGEPVLEDGREVDFEFFALVDGFEKEFGYVFLNELESIRGPLGLPIERDRYWQPQTVKQIAPELFLEAEK